LRREAIAIEIGNLLLCRNDLLIEAAQRLYFLGLGIQFRLQARLFGPPR
jgi:hypothetical protein